MCMPKTPKMPAAPKPAATPAAPLPTAENLKMNERQVSRDGTVGRNTARSRRTMRTDVRVSGQAGPQIARMG